MTTGRTGRITLRSLIDDRVRQLRALGFRGGVREGPCNFWLDDVRWADVAGYAEQDRVYDLAAVAIRPFWGSGPLGTWFVRDAGAPPAAEVWTPPPALRAALDSYDDEDDQLVLVVSCSGETHRLVLSGRSIRAPDRHHDDEGRGCASAIAAIRSAPGFVRLEPLAAWRWIEEGFTPLEAMRWCRWVTAIPSEARAWRDAGASATQTLLCLRRGILDPAEGMPWLNDPGRPGGTLGSVAALIRAIQASG